MRTFGVFHTLHLCTLGSRATSPWLLCAIGLLLIFPQGVILSQSAAQRDQQALAILTQTVAAGGGQQMLASIQDFTETGTVTYYWVDQVTGNVTVKGRGLHQLKIEAALPNGKQTAVISGDSGSLIETNGQTLSILRQSANDLGSFTIPYLPLVAAVQDSSVSIVYAGLVTQDGATSYDIRIRKLYTQQQDPVGTRGAREARDFYIDPKTFLISGISDRIYFGGANDQGISHQLLYSNYQEENGIMVPLTIQENAHDATGCVLTLNQVTFNSGLVDSDFAW